MRRAERAPKLKGELRRSSCSQGSSLVFYGDSITETWRGSDGGHPCPRCAGVPEVFQQYFGRQYSSAVLAVGGEVHIANLSCLEWHSMTWET